MTVEPHLCANPAPLSYTVQTFSKIIGISRPSLYRMMAAGELRSVRVRGRRLIPASEARRLLKEVV